MEKGKEITAEQAREISRNPSTSDTATQIKFNEVKENLFHFIEQESKKGAREAGYILKENLCPSNYTFSHYYLRNMVQSYFEGLGYEVKYQEKSIEKNKILIIFTVSW